MIIDYYSSPFCNSHVIMAGFLTRIFVICRGWQGLAPKSWGLALWFTYGVLWEALNCIPVSNGNFKHHWICWIMWPKGQSCFHGSLALLQSLLLFWVPVKSSSFLGSLSQCASVTYPNEDCVTSKIQRGPLGIVLVLVVEGTRCNLPFSLERKFSLPHSTGPLNISRNFVECIPTCWHINVLPVSLESLLLSAHGV